MEEISKLNNIFLYLVPKKPQGQVKESVEGGKDHSNIINEASPSFFIWNFEFFKTRLIAQNENIV